MKNAAYISKIRSFYAKNTFKREGNRWVKQYEAIPGIVIIRCAINNTAYFAKATNMRRAASRWRAAIRAKKTRSGAMNKDIARYGIDVFEVKAGESLQHVPEEYIEMRLEMLYRSYITSHTNTYNKHDMMHRYIPLFERARYTALGGTAGRSQQLVNRTAEIKGAVIYVITNKTNQKRLICAVADFERSWFAIHSQLRRGVFRNAELQQDWVEHGEAAFVADFYRCNRDDLRATKTLVLRAFNNLYGNKYEKAQAGAHVVDRRGKLAG